MANAREWVEGARLRTLPASISAVVAGTGVAWFAATTAGPPFSSPPATSWAMPVLCLIVGLGFQIGGNFSNDYSDGIRGTDDNRVGPMRLVGSGAASPGAVKRAAWICFAVALLAGLVIICWAFSLFSAATWQTLAHDPAHSDLFVPLILVVVGAACLLAAWFYTGGKRPYGYSGLGEVFVFIFFGLVPAIGTAYVVAPRLCATCGRQLAWWPAILAGILTGAISTGILVANNLRDIDTDRAAGKITLPVRLGDKGTRWLYTWSIIIGGLCVIVIGVISTWYALIGLAGLILIVPSVRQVLAGAKGRDLIHVLKMTGLAELATCVLLTVGLGIGWYA